MIGGLCFECFGRMIRGFKRVDSWVEKGSEYGSVWMEY